LITLVFLFKALANILKTKCILIISLYYLVFFAVLLLVSALMMELAARCALSVGDDDLNQSSVLRLSCNTYQTQILHLLSF
jgi:hypothetical protein